MKNLLVFGGTRFLGRALVEELFNTNRYDIVLFNRGKTNPNLFIELKTITGNRNSDDIQKISNQYWDYVIDLSCFYPHPLEKLLANLKDKIGRYIFISTATVYKFEKFNSQELNEECETVYCSEEEKIGETYETYNQRKAECERVLLKCNWLDKIILRPSLIYGKYDPTDRLYYWLFRAKTQNEILIPDGGITKCNFTFVEDVVKLIIAALEIKNHSTIYNAIMEPPIPFMHLLKSIEKAFNSSPSYINATSEFLQNRGVIPWLDIPLWSDFDMMFDCTKVRNDFNHTFYSLEESIKKTVEYYNSLMHIWTEKNYGLKITLEKELIRELKS